MGPIADRQVVVTCSEKDCDEESVCLCYKCDDHCLAVCGRRPKSEEAGFGGPMVSDCGKCGD